MPRCRTPIPSKGKQRIWAIFYMKRSIETQIAVVITCTADKRWMTCARGIPAVYLAVPSIQAKIQMMSHHQLHPFAFTLSLLCLCNAQSVRTTSFRDPSSLNWGQDRCWKCRVASRPHGHTVRTATGYLVPILVHSVPSYLRTPLTVFPGLRTARMAARGKAVSRRTNGAGVGAVLAFSFI